MTKKVATAAQAVANISDGSTVLMGGFGDAGQPMELIEALLDSGATDLTVVNNNAGQADAGLALLIKEQIGRASCRERGGGRGGRRREVKDEADHKDLADDNRSVMHKHTDS